MRFVSANLLALFFLCTCSSVLYVWSRLEDRLGRHKRGLHGAGAHFAYGKSVDLSARTFRALLAVPSAQKSHHSNRVEIHNSSNTKDKAINASKGDYHSHVTKLTSNKREALRLTEIIEDGIFWSQRLEDYLPVGFSKEHAQAWRQRARGSLVVSLEPGCGRVSNQLATFSDGSKACVRYGINADQIQGETLSYYLANLLGITNIPPIILSRLNVDGEQWDSVRYRIDGLQWSAGAIVSLTEWVANLTGVVTPAPLRQESKGLHPLLTELENKTIAGLVELVQWTDLIMFDYLTANFDRLVSNLFSLQWDARVMERDTSNLLRTPSGDLVFIDNEAGLVHGYRVLDMWERYHSSVLSSVCLFRKGTAQHIIDLHRSRDTRLRLFELYRDREPLAPELGFLSDEHARTLQGRIDRLYKHIVNCKDKYSQL
ncbi:four-jointed box protein 1-like [Alosa sapidissima]|uniref:four-jointed box protein 1-like n=1 Tax=Alosa sapidissima TaxID=34773 RepID=UPI001C0838D7|nr:four-jointed box protein 1-like [Alosa sapidissima]